MSKSNGPIRRWLGKLGLVSDYSSEEQIPTAELPDIPSVTQPEPEPEPEKLSEQELEVSTADTRPLPPEWAEVERPIESKTDEQKMESEVTPVRNQTGDLTQRGSGPLLDLGDFEPARAAAEDDFVLDLDFEDSGERPAPVASSSFGSNTFGGQEAAQPSGVDSVAVADYQDQEAPSQPSEATTDAGSLELTADPMAETQELMRPTMAGESQASERTFAEPEILEGEAVRMVSEPVAAGQITLEQLSPEAIDAIARRTVEMLSEKVVQEIAWEVVPQLAELLIKRQLEEKNS